MANSQNSDCQCKSAETMAPMAERGIPALNFRHRAHTAGRIISGTSIDNSSNSKCCPAVLICVARVAQFIGHEALRSAVAALQYPYSNSRFSNDFRLTAGMAEATRHIVCYLAQPACWSDESDRTVGGDRTLELFSFEVLRAVQQVRRIRMWPFFVVCRSDCTTI